MSADELKASFVKKRKSLLFQIQKRGMVLVPKVWLSLLNYRTDWGVGTTKELAMSSRRQGAGMNRSVIDVKGKILKLNSKIGATRVSLVNTFA